MLSPLQQRIRRVLSDLSEGGDMALAGGAALIVWGVVTRPTEDLDFFVTSAEAVNRLVPSIEAALQGDGLEVRRVQVADGFGRLMVSSRDDETVVDVGWDARRCPRQATDAGPLLAVDELAGDKLLALFGRAAARDFVDVSALVDRYGLERLCQLAAEKDPGFDRRALADMLGRVHRLPRAEFGLDDTAFDGLIEQVQEWAMVLTAESREPEPPPRGRSLER
jgi:hypothetical protein